MEGHFLVILEGREGHFLVRLEGKERHFLVIFEGKEWYSQGGRGVAGPLPPSASCARPPCCPSCGTCVKNTSEVIVPPSLCSIARDFFNDFEALQR